MPRSIKVHTLDGSKDVWGAGHEPKGRVDLNVLAAGRTQYGPKLYQM